MKEKFQESCLLHRGYSGDADISPNTVFLQVMISLQPVWCDVLSLASQALFLLQLPLLLHSEGLWTVSTALQMSTDWPGDPATLLTRCEQTENKSSDKSLNANVPRSHLCYIFRCCNKMPGPK